MHSQKEYELKITKITIKYKQEIDSLKAKLSKVRCDAKYLRKRNRELTVGRDSWKEKHKGKQFIIRNLKAKITYSTKSKYHHYDDWLINLCVQLRIQCNCSYQSITKILLILRLCFNLQCHQLPCANTIQNWVSKVGLNRLQSTDNELHSKKVTLIIDENIRLGNEKLLLILSVDWHKVQQGALCFKDAEVVYMEGSTSWTGASIAAVLQKLRKEKKLEIMNILSDEDGKLKKASGLCEIPHLPEISHAVATCLRKTFLHLNEYSLFTKLVASYQSKGVNQSLSYLCPPKQRVKARFMNQKKLITWANKVLTNFGMLNKKERMFFSKLADHQETMKMLSICLEAADRVSLPLKTKGLSSKTLQKSKTSIKKLKRKHKDCATIITFLTYLEEYLAYYQDFIDKYAQNDICINASSEIIESMFGKYKSKANNYALTGLTNLNLELPLYCIEAKEFPEQVSDALVGVSMTDLKQWKKNHSPDSQLVKRREFFKKRT